MVYFYKYGADFCKLRTGVRLVSITPEDVLVRGFLHNPNVEETFEPCVQYVERMTGVRVKLLRVDLKTATVQNSRSPVALPCTNSLTLAPC